MTSIEQVRLQRLGKLAQDDSPSPGRLTVGFVALAIGFFIGFAVGQPDYTRIVRR